MVPETLDYCWRIQTAGTALDGCPLEIDHVPAVVACATCGATTELTSPLLRCGGCDGSDVQLISGEEFLIESLDVVEGVG